MFLEQINLFLMFWLIVLNLVPQHILKLLEYQFYIEQYIPYSTKLKRILIDIIVGLNEKLFQRKINYHGKGFSFIYFGFLILSLSSLSIKSIYSLSSSIPLPLSYQSLFSQSLHQPFFFPPPSNFFEHLALIPPFAKLFQFLFSVCLFSRMRNTFFVLKLINPHIDNQLQNE